MPLVRTTDHDEIRNWVEENGGKPAVIRGTSRQKRGDEALTMIFGKADPDPDTVVIVWEEFFEIFEARRLSFRYEHPVSQSDAAMSYSIESRDMAPDSSREPETTEHVEDQEHMEENIFPSQPAERAEAPDADLDKT